MVNKIRIILECQNRTICRGPNSIFGRLRKEGIDVSGCTSHHLSMTQINAYQPDDYINIFSLRNWAKLRGDVLTTEQVSFFYYLLVSLQPNVAINYAGLHTREGIVTSNNCSV